MCAFVDRDQDYEEMKWKMWIWQKDVRKGPKQKEGMNDLMVEHKDLEWTWKRKDGKLQVWKEELWIWKKWKVYQHLEILFLQWDTYHF